MRSRRTVDDVLGVLRTTAPWLAEVTSGLGEEQFTVPLEADGWSLQEILAHLRACQDTWGADIQRILTEDQPRFRYRSPRGEIRKTDDPEQPFRPALEAFTRDRAALLAALDASGADGWARTATIVQNGKADERTVLDVAARMSDHELVHREHLESTLRAG